MIQEMSHLAVLSMEQIIKILIKQHNYWFCWKEIKKNKFMKHVIYQIIYF